MSVIRQIFLSAAVVTLCFSINMLQVRAGTGDVEIILGDIAGVGAFQVQNSATATVFQVDSLGRVAIGTTTSVTALQVVGSITVTSATSTPGVEIGVIADGVTGTLTVNGDLRVTGGISKGAGTFDISHPDSGKADDGYRLRHSFVESPTRGDNLYRYEVEIESEEGETAIELPSYWKFLNENAQVWVSAKGQFARGYGYVDEESGKLIIKGEKKGTYNVLLVGTRKDKFAKEFFDPLGVEYKTNPAP
ncbi:MAG: hypothetical protein ACUZ8H_07205 [Candidatus Anammoxibacter sp.]